MKYLSVVSSYLIIYKLSGPGNHIIIYLSDLTIYWFVFFHLCFK